MVNVAVVSTNSITKTGVTSVILNLLRKMEKSGLHIYMFTDKKIDQSIKNQFDNMGINVISLKNKRNGLPFLYINELKQEFINRNIKVLHVHGNSATMWFEVFAAKQANIGIRIAHSHSSSCLSRVLHYILRPLLVHDITLGIGCSDLAQKFAFNNRKSIVLKNGIITDDFKFDESYREDCRKEFNFANKFVFGHVGNFLSVKNHIFLCRIVKELRDRGVENFKAICLGDGVTRSEIEKYICVYQLNNYIDLLGSRNDISRFYHAMDLFILPSLYEGFPMVLVEAQTSGLQCVISDKVTKTTNILGNAVYLPIDNEDAVEIWADKIEELMKHKYNAIVRCNAKKVVDEAGYSAQYSADYLRKIYCGEI